MLAAQDVEDFVRKGFVRIRGAVAAETVAACRAVIWGELNALGRFEDPASWDGPFVRLPCPEGGPFVDAGTSPLLWRAYDQLIGPGRWLPREGVGGNLFIRFPSEEVPHETTWHIDGAYLVGDEWRTNIHCRDKGLLALFLFSDIGERDAPTRLLVGSHLDMAAVLEPSGGAGLPFDDICRRIPSATLERDVVTACGRRGDVYLCHPLLVHSPSWPHRGHEPRMLAQPGVSLREPFALTDAASAFPVERAILRGLEASTPSSV